MTVIALQAPMAPASQRFEPTTPSAFALTAVQTVSSLQDTDAQRLMADHRPFGKPLSLARHEKPTLDPFPELRFADPLPDLPDLELPQQANPYLAALSVLRRDDGS
jgi:hypothetical protein